MTKMIDFLSAEKIIRDYFERWQLSVKADILNEDIKTPRSIPPFNRSMVDGYAVTDNVPLQKQLFVQETVAAGAWPSSPLNPASPERVTKVMTGAPCPINAARVVKREDIEHDGLIVIREHKAERHIMPAGAELMAGEVLLPAGTTLRSIEKGLLASIGLSLESAEVKIRRSPRLALLATGDEVRSHEIPLNKLSAAEIYNANSPMLADYASRLGWTVQDLGVVRDADVLNFNLSRHCQNSDLILCSGGVSMGDFDFVPDLLHREGFTLLFDRVAMKPGKPLTFAVREHDRKIFLGLPGNPVAAFVTFHVLVAGAKRIRVHLAAGEEAKMQKKRDGERFSFWPARFNERGEVVLLPYLSSGHLAALMRAEALLEIPCVENEDIYVRLL